MSGKYFGNISEYAVTPQDVEQAIRACEQTFGMCIEVQITRDRTSRAYGLLHVVVTAFLGSTFDIDSITAQSDAIIPNERCKTLDGQLLWSICEVYDKLEHRSIGDTTTHITSIERFLASHWQYQK